MLLRFLGRADVESREAKSFEECYLFYLLFSLFVIVTLLSSVINSVTIERKREFNLLSIENQQPFVGLENLLEFVRAHTVCSFARLCTLTFSSTRCTPCTTNADVIVVNDETFRHPFHLIIYR